MAGHIRKRTGRDGKPSYQALLSWRDAETGKTIQVNGGTHARKKDAEDALVALATKYRGGRRMTNTDRTFAMLADEYLKTIVANKASQTAKRYRSVLNQHFIPALGDQRVRDLTTKDFDDVFAALLQSHMASSVTTLKGVASGVMTQAVRWGWRNDNPVKLTQAIVVPEGSIDVFAPEQIRSIIETADALDPMFGAFSRFCAAVGPRPGETCALQVGDIDWAEGAVRIWKTALQSGKVQEVTKTGRERTVYVDAATLGKLAEWRDLLAKRLEFIGVEMTATTFLFSSDRDPAHRKPLNPKAAAERFNHVMHKLGMDGCLMDLRHTVSTTLVDGEIPVPAAAEMMGNSPKTLLKHYARATDTSKRRAATTMGAFLGGETATDTP